LDLAVDRANKKNLTANVPNLATQTPGVLPLEGGLANLKTLCAFYFVQKPKDFF